MLRRAIQRARLHVPAPIGHDNGGAGVSSDDEDAPPSPSVAHTTLRDDEAVREHFRRLPEDVSGVHLLAAGEAARPQKTRVAQLSADEQRRAADAWTRLQTLYGLFRELEAAADDGEDSDTESVEADERQPPRPEETRRRRTRDDGLRSLLQEAQLPPGVVFRDLQTLATADGSDDNAMPQGFTAGMFAALGNAMYNEMLVAAEQNRISSDAFEELGNCLYAEAASVAVSATA